MTNESGLRPMEYNVVIRMDPTEEKTAGGIILLKDHSEREKLASDEGTLVAASPLAFTFADDHDWAGEKPQIGQRVLFAQYAGRIVKRGDVEYRVIKDKDIVAVVEPAAESVRNPLANAAPSPYAGISA